MCLLLRGCRTAHRGQTKGVALLVGERNVFASVWAAEERIACDENVGQEAEPECVEGVVEVRCVANRLNGNTEQ